MSYPLLIKLLIRAYYWPIGPAMRYIFTLCGKVTHPLTKWPVGILSLPLLPGLYLSVSMYIEVFARKYMPPENAWSNPTKIYQNIPF